MSSCKPMFATCRMHHCVVPGISLSKTVDKTRCSHHAAMLLLAVLLAVTCNLSSLVQLTVVNYDFLELLCTSSGRLSTADAGKPTTSTSPEHSDSASAASPAPPWKASVVDTAAADLQDTELCKWWQVLLLRKLRGNWSMILLLWQAWLNSNKYTTYSL